MGSNLIRTAFGGVYEFLRLCTHTTWNAWDQTRSTQLLVLHIRYGKGS